MCERRFAVCPITRQMRPYIANSEPAGNGCALSTTVSWTRPFGYRNATLISITSSYRPEGPSSSLVGRQAKPLLIAAVVHAADIPTSAKPERGGAFGTTDVQERPRRVGLEREAWMVQALA